MDDTESEFFENPEKENVVKRRNKKRRWRDEESRTGGYSRAKFRDVGLRIAMDQLDAIIEE